MEQQSYDWSSWETYAALAIFVVVWLLIARKWACLPIGRTAGALIGAVLMVQLQIITVQEANKSIEISTLLLLLGLMVILAALESKGLVHFLTAMISYGNVTPLSLLWRISIFSGLLSATVMNDGAALFLSLVVKSICSQYDLPLGPYLIAMATSANIGSAATVLGNPKNMVIHNRANINFLDFLVRMGPPAAIGLIVNTIFLCLYFRNSLTPVNAIVKSTSERASFSSIRTTSPQTGKEEGESSDEEVDEFPLKSKLKKDAEADERQIQKQIRILALHSLPQSVNTDDTPTPDAPQLGTQLSKNEQTPLLLPIYSTTITSTPSSIPPLVKQQSLRQPAFQPPPIHRADSKTVSPATVFYESPGKESQSQKSNPLRSPGYGAVSMATSPTDTLVEEFPGLAENEQVIFSPGAPLNLFQMFDFHALHSNANPDAPDSGSPKRISENKPNNLDTVDEIWKTRSESERAKLAGSLESQQIRNRTNKIGQDDDIDLATFATSSSLSSTSETVVVNGTNHSTPIKLKLPPRTPKPTPVSVKQTWTDYSDWIHQHQVFNKLAIVFLIIGMYAGFLAGYDLGWTCLAAAVALILIEREEPSHLFSEVNWELLLYLIAIFVTIEGINHTPLTNVFWDVFQPLMEPGRSLGFTMFGFCSLVMTLCLVFTSIPCVLLVSPHLNQLTGPLSHFSWLLLAWSVTLSGNLTMFSSVAGVIASEAAEASTPITFWTWCKFSFPSTIIILAGGAYMLGLTCSVQDPTTTAPIS